MSDSVKNIIKVVAVILAIAVGFALVKKFFVKALEVTDVSAWATMSEERIESELGFALENDPSMVKLIYAYTEGEVTVSGNRERGVGVVYIDGVQSGLHIDNSKYGMFGIELGMGETEVNGAITFDYEEEYTVLNDISEGTSTAMFFQNHSKGDCFVVVVNDMTHRVVALTYFTDGNKATNSLSFY